MKLILASASPQRAKLLHKLVKNFSVRPARIRENISAKKSAAEITEKLATKKARTVFKLGTLTLGCDTLGELDGWVFGKPSNKIAAKKLLQKLSGKTHRVVSAFCLKSVTQEIIGHELATVTFRKLKEKEIEDYIENNPVLSYAGAYAIQGAARKFIKKIQGPRDTVIGLPTRSLKKALKLIS